MDPDLVDVERRALEALSSTIIRKPGYKADRKGLIFILHKLGEVHSDQALEYCLDNLPDLPDIAPDCSRYLEVFAERESVQQRVLQFVTSADCVYDWQSMHLVKGMVNPRGLISDLFDFAFAVALDRNRHFCLRSTCIDLVSQFGGEENVRELCRRFASEPFEEVRGAIILASQRLRGRERKKFLGTWKGISPALDAAISMAWNAS